MAGLSHSPKVFAALAAAVLGALLWALRKRRLGLVWILFKILVAVGERWREERGLKQARELSEKGGRA
jgi:hypothetical protein